MFKPSIPATVNYFVIYFFFVFLNVIMLNIKHKPTCSEVQDAVSSDADKLPPLPANFETIVIISAYCTLYTELIDRQAYRPTDRLID